jgi:hypothetical protein
LRKINQHDKHFTHFWLKTYSTACVVFINILEMICFVDSYWWQQKLVMRRLYPKLIRRKTTTTTNFPKRVYYTTFLWARGIFYMLKSGTTILAHYYRKSSICEADLVTFLTGWYMQITWSSRTKPVSINRNFVSCAGRYAFFSEFIFVVRNLFKN